MSRFAQRSKELELMDLPIEDDQAIFQNFDELVFINARLGGSNHSLAAIDAVTLGMPRPTIVDVGFGAGDFLDEARTRWPEADLVGVDLMPQALTYAKRRYPSLASEVDLRCESYQDWMKRGVSVDVVHAALFCHHLDHDSLVDFLRQAAQHAKVAVVINDLQRHWFAYHAIKRLTRWFARSRYTQHDAPLSVLRGFTRREWEAILDQAGLPNHRIQWKWAFRHVVTILPS